MSTAAKVSNDVIIGGTYSIKVEICPKPTKIKNSPSP
jgi:hypothetical protein